MSFILNPPVVLKNDIGFSIIQAGHMVSAESMIINMSGWSALDLLHHWHNEIKECLAGRRNKCCIVSGLIISNDNVIPTEWWLIYFVNGKIKLHYQVLSLKSFDNWTTPDEWWKNILPYNQNVSEWIVALNDLENWCSQYDVLLSAIDAMQHG